MCIPIWRFSWLLIASFVISGCATQAQMQYQQMSLQLAQTVNSTQACMKALESHAEYKRLNEVFILGQNDAKAVYKMNINRNASDNEKDDLLYLREKLNPCRIQNLEGMNLVHPDFVSLFAGWYAKNDEELLKVINDKYTIGEWNQIANSIRATRQAEFNDVGKVVSQQLQTVHQSELASRQAAAAAMQQWSYQQQLFSQNQQLINSINRPTTTNCTYVGNTINCRSY